MEMIRIEEITAFSITKTRALGIIFLKLNKHGKLCGRNKINTVSIKKKIYIFAVNKVK
jgi:hypothetical protein